MNQYLEFIKLVSSMRQNQKQYFKTKHTRYLEASKTLEREVDRKVDEELNPKLGI